MSRAAILELIAAAQQAPHAASAYAGQIARALEAERDARSGPADFLDRVPPGSRSLIVDSGPMLAEPLPPTPGALPPWETANPPVPLEIPKNMLIQGVIGYAELGAQNELEADLLLLLRPFLPTTEGGRDLFSVGWELNGERSSVTTGERSVLAPGPTVVGTRARPRRLAWRLRANDRLEVRFRALWNLQLPFATPEELPELFTVRAYLAFFGVPDDAIGGLS